jgi:UDP-2-acetamido-2-deoxy-ribo-hexuluronate aminotransferase
MHKSLKDKDIPSVSYYSVPLHLQPVFQKLAYQAGDFPIAEKVANECLSLPMSPYLTKEDQLKVTQCIS